MLGDRCSLAAQVSAHPMFVSKASGCWWENLTLCQEATFDSHTIRDKDHPPHKCKPTIYRTASKAVCCPSSAVVVPANSSVVPKIGSSSILSWFTCSSSSANGSPAANDATIIAPPKPKGTVTVAQR